MRYFLTFLFIILFQSLSFSQTKISGTIIDENNHPLENINIIIKDTNNLTVEADVTNKLGHFSISTTFEKIKIQVVQFNEVFYEKDIEAVSEINLGEIKITNSNTIEEVTIQSKKTKLKKELGKFIVDNIANSQFSKGKNSYEVLNYVPILNSTENGISIFNKGEATIFIDGKSIGDNETTLNIIKSIPASNIKKIEIIANPDSKFEAKNKNGIINIILKNNENEGIKGSVSASTTQSYYNSQNGNGFISYSKKKISITSGLNLDNNKYFNRYKYTYNNLVANQQTQINSSTSNDVKNYAYFINSDYKLNDKNSFGIQFNYRTTDKNSSTTTNNIFKNINSGTIDSTSLNNITKKTPDNNYLRANFNYKRILDSLGSTLYFDNTQIIKRNNLESNYDFINSNSPNENFIQNQDEKFSINATKLDITKIINEDNKLLFGGNFIYSAIKNYFFHGDFDNNTYVSDPLQTNTFSYTDKTASGYITYEKIINEKWEGKIGFRLENFEGKGRTLSNQNENNIKNTYLFPSFSVLFLPNDNHEFSLDASSYILRPYYSKLNPFLRYTSSNSYAISNPNLLPSLSYEVALSYVIKSKYFFNAVYTYDKNLFNDFDIVLPNNFIQTTTANYGNSNFFDFNFIYVTNFFKKNWNVSTTMNYVHDITKGSYDDVDLSFKNSLYGFSLKNQINLSKKRDFNLGIVYGYRSSNRSVFGTLKNFHSLNLDITKTYKDFNFSFEGSNLTFSNLRIEEAKTNYNFQKKTDYFKAFMFKVRYNSGNKKVKKIEDKNSEINNRL